MSPPRSGREPLLLLAIAAGALGLSGLRPYDRPTWLLEVGPVLMGAPLLIVGYGRFPLRPLLYRLLLLHALILILGAHYSYERVPLGFWLQDLLGLSRNHYARRGPVAQGFIPASLARESLLRLSPLPRGKWLFFLVVCVCLAFSAFYELLEWRTAAIMREEADAFLATQGEIWDSQWDMFLALLGASPHSSCSLVSTIASWARWRRLNTIDLNQSCNHGQHPCDLGQNYLDTHHQL